MNYIEEAIKRAIEGGYVKGKSVINELTGELYLRANPELFLLDPLFWQALGKAEGWKEDINRADFYNQVYRGKNMEISQRSGGCMLEWQYQMHRFIDHLIAGKSTESFFEGLLAKK